MRLPATVAALARHRLVGESAWVFTGQILSALGTLVGVRFVTEFVPPAVFGTVALAVGVIALAHGLAAGALMQGVLRLYPECAAGGTAGALRSAALRALRLPAALAFLAVLIGVTVWAWRANGSPWLGALAALLMLVEVARSVEITLLNAARRQKGMAVFSIANAWLRPAFAVLVVRLVDPSASAVLAGYLAGAMVPLFGFYLSRGFAADADAAAEAASQHARLWRYAKPLVPLPLIGWTSGQADRYLLAALAGLPAAGVYAALYGLASKPFLMLSAGVELALRQVYYGHVSGGQRAAEERSFRLWLAAVLIPAVLISALIGAFHRELAWLLLAAEYRAHSHLMVWIAAGYMLLAAAQVVERICYALHDTRGVALVRTAGAMLSIVVALPMIDAFGLDGAAWSVPIYFGLQLLLTVARARRTLRMRARVAASAHSAPLARRLNA